MNRKDKYEPLNEILEGAQKTAYERAMFGSSKYSNSHYVIPIGTLAKFVKDEALNLVLHDDIPDRINKLCHLPKALEKSEDSKNQFERQHCIPTFRELFNKQLLADWGVIIRSYLAAGITPFIHPNQDMKSDLKDESVAFLSLAEFSAHVNGIMVTIKDAASKLFFDPESKGRADNLLAVWKEKKLLTDGSFYVVRTISRTSSAAFTQFQL